VSDQPWPLWIEGPLGRAAVELGPGDALLYRGIECAHWREPFEYRFDRRPALGLGVETRLPDRTS
jgi:hypothetical protein